jgi:type II secretory pathway pseudopilin PulG
MAKTGYLKKQASGGILPPPPDRRPVSIDFRISELPNFRTLKRPRAAFTVIELLMVIGVLAVLLAIMLPVFSKAREASKRARARVEATALAQAVIQYKNVYGYWPGMIIESGGQLTRNTAALTHTALDTPLVSRGSNTWFEVEARNPDGTTKNVNYFPLSDNALYRALLPFDTRRSGDKNRNPLNSRRVRFLSLKGEEAPASVSLPDPWGKPFNVVMGLDPSCQTTLYDGTWPIVTFSNQTAVAFARAQTKLSTSLYFISAGVTNGVIWRTN